ncbi:MAG: transglutaminase [Ruminococcus sp.]|nr:transglutaminase [Ruminococcus sp.]
MKKAVFAALSAAVLLSSCGLNESIEYVDMKLCESIEEHAARTTVYSEDDVMEIVHKALAAGVKTVEFDGVVSNDMAQNVIKRMRYECPDIFWAKGFSLATDYHSSTLSCDSVHGYDDDKLAEMAEELDAAVDEIAEGVDKSWSDYDKILYVHDYIVDNCEYDYDAAASNNDELIGFAGTSYGCLVEHKAICEGYAQAFDLIMSRLGFDCGMASGIAGDELHAWNYIKADGDYYWLDVTWDDNMTEHCDGHSPRYKFFMLNDRLFLEGKTLGDDVPFVPQCNELDDNYYVHNGLYIDEYDFGTVNGLMIDHYDDGGLDIMFADSESYDAALCDLMENGSIWQTQPMLDGCEPAPYYPDDKLHTLTMSWES